MTTLLYLICCISAISIHFVWMSGVMKRIPQISSLQMLAVSHWVAAACLFGFTSTQLHTLTQPALLGYLLAMGIFMYIARILYYDAYSKADVGEVSIFSALTPTYTLLLSPFFGYALGVQKACGVVLISLAVYAFFLPPRKEETSTLRYLFRPFLRIVSSRPIFFTFLSTFPPAFATIFQKHALEISSPMLVSFSLCLIIAILGSATWLLRKPTPKPHEKHYPAHIIYGALAITGLMQAAMIISNSYLLTLTHPASTQALTRLAIPIQIILAYIFLHERKQLRHRLLASALAIAGVYLIMHPHFQH